MEERKLMKKGMSRMRDRGDGNPCGERS